MNANEPNPNAVVPAAVASPPSFADRKFRQKLRDELRAEEWEMHKELIDVAQAMLKNLQGNPHKHTVADLARVMELSSKLARLATQPDCDLDLGDEGAAVMIDFRAALRKVYTRRESEGRPLPKSVIIDAEMVGDTAPPKPDRPAGNAAQQNAASGAVESKCLLSCPVGQGEEGLTPIDSCSAPTTAQAEGQGSNSTIGG